MSLERMLEVKRAFKRYSAKLSPELRDTYEDKYTKQGRFQLREQTPQVRYPRPHFSLTLSELDIFMVTMAQIKSTHCLVGFPSHSEIRSW